MRIRLRRVSRRKSVHRQESRKISLAYGGTLARVMSDSLGHDKRNGQYKNSIVESDELSEQLKSHVRLFT